MRRPVVTVVGAGTIAAGDGRTRGLGDLGGLGYDLRGVRVHARVSTREDLGGVLDVVMRGATVSVELAAHPVLEPSFLDELQRVADVRRAEPARLGPTTAELLRLLAEGATVHDAARALHLSTRSAYRRLSEARAVLGVATTAEAVRTVGPDGRVTPAP